MQTSKAETLTMHQQAIQSISSAAHPVSCSDWMAMQLLIMPLSGS